MFLSEVWIRETSKVRLVLPFHRFAALPGSFWKLGLFLRRLFFYPVGHIWFVHPQNFPDSTGTDTSIIHFDCQFSGFFRVGVLLRVDRIDYAALLTLAALASRWVTPYFDLICGFSAFGAPFPCLFCRFSHVTYYIITFLFWTLPSCRRRTRLWSYKDRTKRLIFRLALLCWLRQKVVLLYDKRFYVQTRVLCLLQLQKQYSYLFRAFYQRRNLKAVCPAKDIWCDDYVFTI